MRLLFESFKEEVVRELNKHTIGLHQQKHFLPARSRRALVTRDRLKELLPDNEDAHIRWLLENGQIILLISLLSLNHYEEFADALTWFQNQHFDDSYLPIPDLTVAQEELCKCDGNSDGNDALDKDSGSTLGMLPCHHQRFERAFSLSCWGLLSKRNFYNEQWSFLLPHFDSATFVYELDGNRILPFLVEPQNNARTGGFGDVVHAQIPSEFLSEGTGSSSLHELQSRQDQNVPVAIKTLRSVNDSSYNIEDQWRRELAAHRTFNSFHHKNIVHSLAAFRQDQKYHIILEWASGGSLEDFWAQNPRPQLLASNVLELLEELCGLADALNHLHGTARSRTRTQEDRECTPSGDGDEQQPFGQGNLTTHLRSEFCLDDDSATIEIGSQLVSQDQTSNLNWRHGDLKPANILVFKQDRSWLGTLKIADLGVAKVHKEVTQLRQSNTETTWRTARYEPPEGLATNGRQAMSRLYDIWSLGCVFFECLVWLLYGTEGLEKFHATIETNILNGTSFWSMAGREGAVVSHTVTLWMNSLRSHPECCKQSALGDLLKLIQEKMLVVELPIYASEPGVSGVRAKADDVYMELARMVGKAKANKSYLLLGASQPSLQSSLPVVPWITTDNSESMLALPIKAPSTKQSPTLQDQLQTHLKRKLRKSKSYTDSTTRQRPQNEQESMALTMPKLNHITLTRSNITSQFSHSLRDTWHYENDNSFAEKTLRTLYDSGKSFNKLYTSQDVELCEACLQFDPVTPASFKSRSMSSLRRSAEDCNLCEYLFHIADQGGLLSTHEVSLTRHGGLMKINNRFDMRMRICRSPGE